MSMTDANESDLLLPITSALPSHPPPPYTRTSTAPAPLRRLEGAPTALEWNGSLGDLILESVEGSKFLVHRELLEKECAFFYIYYHTHPRPEELEGSGSSSLFCLGRWFNNPPSTNTHSPPLPPKVLPVKSPQPISHHEWMVPETEEVLFAFLSLIYPHKRFPTPEQLSNPALLRDLLRTALGYQSERAVHKIKRALAELAPLQAIEVYAIASKYRLHDISHIASRHTLSVPSSLWTEEQKALMDPKASASLKMLHEDRTDALRMLLSPASLQTDEHSAGCHYTEALQAAWDRRVGEMHPSLGPVTEMAGLVHVEWNAVAGCVQCTRLLQATIVEVMQQEKRLSDTI